MQYYLDGFKSGDPTVLPEHKDSAPQSSVDVAIVGCGPAGLTLAAQLSAFPDISVRIFERKSGPLEFGQADGIACRSVEMFEAFGFAEKVLKEAYWVNEVAFWRADGAGQALTRRSRIQDVEDDLSEMPHVILSQARVHDFYLDIMAKSPRRLHPDYGCEVIGVQPADDADYPNALHLRRENGEDFTVKARYIVGCDGARSIIRRHMGHELKGEASRQLWGVMDVLAVTDFPDIRLKAAIQSADAGSILIIPREGGYMLRMYIELDELQGDERAADRNLSADMLIEKARAILSPFSFEVREVAWWSAYEIGQRVCDAFDDVPDDIRDSRLPRLFIAGDACHTHSPKAGQGMNVSMADTFNLGWKLAAVLRGQARPELLHSYSAERRAKAKELIDFDRDMARLFSAKPRTPAEADLFQQYFKTHTRYTAGVETRYDPSGIVGDGAHQHLAKGQLVGKRFHSAPVIRFGDARRVELGHAFKADGRWRLLGFAGRGDTGAAGGAMADLCAYLADADSSPIKRYTPAGQDIDSVIDLRAVFQTPHREMDAADLPAILQPRKGRYGLIDYEKVFNAPLNDGRDIYDRRGIDRQQGALLVIRPDQFVAAVLPLTAPNELETFFAGFMIAIG